MARSYPGNTAGPPPPWASALGTVVIVLGVFFAAYQANEWMKYFVLSKAMPDGAMPAAVCPAEELAEEHISREECEYLVAHVEGLVLSMPPWFSGLQRGLAVSATALAFLSLFVGGALVNYRPWAAPAALYVFGGMLTLDGLQFAAVVNTGPVLRSIYLWAIVLWFLLHLMIFIAIVTGLRTEKKSPRFQGRD